MVDLWYQSVDGNVSRPAAEFNNSQSKCSQKSQLPGCVFEDDMFHSQVIKIIQGQAAETRPLFLYWAAHACHGPREAPQQFYDKFSFIDNKQRQMYHALMNYLDSMVGNVVGLLKETQMYEDTLLVWSSDNGGDDGANNYPLRGAKFSNWQGGIHVGAFVSGGWLPASRRGIKLSGTAALWDLYATFGHAAGLSAAAARSDAPAADAGLPAVDSIDQLDYWLGTSAGPPRTELAVGTAYGNAHGGGNAFFATSVEALIQGEMKLILTPVGMPIDEAIWTGPQYPNATAGNQTKEWATTMDCSRGCLYNLTADITEHVNLAEELPVSIDSTSFCMQFIIIWSILG